MKMTNYVGMDVHKKSISVAVAEGERGGEVRYWGDIDNSPDALERMVKKLRKPGVTLDWCYEAGGCGYGIYRKLISMDEKCSVIAPSKIPMASGDRVKTDRRDAQRLAVLHRAGELTPVWVPDETHEAMRDLTRARIDATMQLMTARQQLLAFLLRHGRTYETGKNWTTRHHRWLYTITFEEPVLNIVLHDYIEAVWAAEERRNSLAQRIEELLPQWSLGYQVEALRCFRGLELISASTFMAAIGDLTRFESPRQLMSYLGLTPSEYSSGGSIKKGGITKTGSTDARRMLVEAAWCYRHPARISQDKGRVLEKHPKFVRDLAWKAQVRLCSRYRKLLYRGKKSTVVSTAIARELSGFIWALGQELNSTTQ